LFCFSFNGLSNNERGLSHDQDQQDLDQDQAPDPMIFNFQETKSGNSRSRPVLRIPSPFNIEPISEVKSRWRRRKRTRRRRTRR